MGSTYFTTLIAATLANQGGGRFNAVFLEG